MRPDSNLLVALARIRDRLIDPTPASLEACTRDLEGCIRDLRRLSDAGVVTRTAPQLRILASQIGALHAQAGALRFGAARAAVAEAAGYKPTGEPGEASARPNLTISG
jgi:hypothetical protein